MTSNDTANDGSELNWLEDYCRLTRMDLDRLG